MSESMSPLLQQMQGLSPEVLAEGELLAQHLHYSTFNELLHASSHSTALVDASFKRKPVSHKELTRFIREDFTQLLSEVRVGVRVCVCLPNIPELGTCIVGLLATHRVVFPVNPAMTSTEMQWEIGHTRCEAVIVLESAASSSSAVVTAANALHIPIYGVQPSAEMIGLFHVTRVSIASSGSEMDDVVSTYPSQTDPPSSSVVGAKRHPELVLLLFTSGTSGHKKLVPYSLDMLVVGVACIISSVTYPIVFTVLVFLLFLIVFVIHYVDLSSVAITELRYVFEYDATIPHRWHHA